MRAWPALAAALALLLPLAQAAEQPKEAPPEFRNGQSNAFGTIAMEPYLQAGPGPVPVVAHVTLRDLGALVRAETVMLALNLHGKEARLAIDGAFAADGSRIPSLRQGPDDSGRQMQLFVAADELESRAVGGEVALTLAGQATPKANGQVHVGVLVVAYDGDWGEVRSADGPAKLYGYSMVQSTAFGGGLMPFHGQGNTMLVVPLVFLALFAIAAGVMSIQALRAGVGLPRATFEPFAPVPASAPSWRPVKPPAPLPPPRRRVLIHNTEIELSPLKEEPAPAPRPAPSPPGARVPVFGSPVSPPAPRPAPAFQVSTGPVQGPLLPPHWGRPVQSPLGGVQPVPYASASSAPPELAEGESEPEAAPARAPKAAAAGRAKRAAPARRKRQAAASR
jgi:hypothetical protein